MAANAPDAVPAPTPALMPDELDSRHLVRRLVALVVLVALEDEQGPPPPLHQLNTPPPSAEVLPAIVELTIVR